MIFNSSTNKLYLAVVFVDTCLIKLLALQVFTLLFSFNPFSHGELKIIFLKNLFNICTNITAKTHN